MKKKQFINGICVFMCCSIICGCSTQSQTTQVEKTQIETTVEETMSTEELQKALDEIYNEIDNANQLCNGVASIVYEYWDYNGFEAFVIKDEFERLDAMNNTSHNYKSGSFYGDAKLTWDAREKIEKLMDDAHMRLKEMKPSSEVQGYYDAVKELYLNVDSYCSFATGYPDGYSKVSYSQTFSDHQKEYDELISKVNFEK